MRKRISNFVKFMVFFVLLLLGLIYKTVESKAAVSLDWEYEINEDNTITLTKYFGSEAEVYVPVMMEDRYVTDIGYKAFAGCKTITAVYIPNGVETIGNKSFYDCSNLISVFLPDSVSSIGGSAFLNCVRLNYIRLGNAVNSISAYTFKGCKQLETIVFPDSIKTIGTGAFMNCKKLADISIPLSVNKLGSNVFYGCIGLKRITILNPRIKLKEASFYNCNALIYGYMDSTVSELPGFKSMGAYGKCNKNISWFFNSETGTLLIRGIGKMPEYERAEAVPWYDFSYKIVCADIGNGITGIGSYSFYKFGNLETVSGCRDVKNVSKNAFYQNTKLKTVGKYYGKILLNIS